MSGSVSSPEVTRAVAILNAAMKCGMLPEGAIPEGDEDKVVEAAKIVELAKQAKTVADQVGQANVPKYQGIVDVLFEAEVTQGIGSNGSAAEELPDAPPAPASEEESAPADSGDSASPPAGGSSEEVVDVGTITVLDKPQTNERIYTHHGCDGGETSYMVPLDDCPPPKSGEETEECANCAYIAPIVSYEIQESFIDPGAGGEGADPAQGEVWTDADGGHWVVDHGGSGPQVEVHAEGEAEKTLVPRGFLKERLTTAPVPPPGTTPTPEPEPSEPEATTPEEPPKSPEPTEIVDDDEGDEEYANLLDRVERDYHPVGMPAPQDLESPPEGMPADLTSVGDLESRRLHSQFNALSSRARYLRGLEAAKARDCERMRKLYLKPAMRAARASMGKDASVTEVTAQAEENSDEVRKWGERAKAHSDRAEAYGVFFDMYDEDVTVLSRDWTMRAKEEQGS